MDKLIMILPLVIGFLLDKFLGDPSTLPHLIVYMGKLISFFEKKINHDKNRKLKGAILAILLVIFVSIVSYLLINVAYSLNIYIGIVVSGIFIFYCIAGKTLIDEVRGVFEALDISLEAGRVQLSRIVGRDTSKLSAHEIKTASLETLSENLSDGVIAPLFWYAIGGIPAMVAYKMINTMDSMIGYKNDRYAQFGYTAAKLDDIVNYIPARITALLMIIVNFKWNVFKFVLKYGNQHASPNSGYPEAALAGILNCRFGGTHTYFGKSFYKPFIGNNERELNNNDLKISLYTNRASEILMILIIMASFYLFY